jgi:hypothetical protein
VAEAETRIFAAGIVAEAGAKPAAAVEGKEAAPAVVVQAAPAQALEPKMTRVLEQKEEEPPAALPKKAEAETGKLEEAFTELLNNLAKAQTMGKSLQAKGLAVQSGLDGSIQQLQTVTDEMKKFEQQASEAGLIDILLKLNKNPNDVTLLMSLAQHSTLMGRILNNYFVQAAAIEKIKGELEENRRKYAA